MRRSPVALAVLVAVALTASACGSSSKSSGTSATTGGSGDSGGGATAILTAIDTKAATGPQKLKLDLSVDIRGTPTNAR